MPDQRSHPWLLSLGFHILLGSFVVLMAVQTNRPAPVPLRMRLVMPATRADDSGRNQASESWWTAKAAPVPRTDPTSPDWQGTSVPINPRAGKILAPASLDELLGVQPPEAAGVPETPPPPRAFGWSGPGGTGYTPPPLPPPQWAPPGGTEWTLTFTVPGAGGYPSAVDGLDSGHPDLDNWLGDYLRTVSFPPSFNGTDYQLRWVLNLETGKPQ